VAELEPPFRSPDLVASTTCRAGPGRHYGGPFLQADLLADFEHAFFHTPSGGGAGSSRAVSSDQRGVSVHRTRPDPQAVVLGSIRPAQSPGEADGLFSLGGVRKCCGLWRGLHAVLLMADPVSGRVAACHNRAGEECGSAFFPRRFVTWRASAVVVRIFLLWPSVRRSVAPPISVQSGCAPAGGKKLERKRPPILWPCWRALGPCWEDPEPGRYR